MAVDSAARNDRAFCMLVRLACRCELFRFLVNKRASPPPCFSSSLQLSLPLSSLPLLLSPILSYTDNSRRSFPWRPQVQGDSVSPRHETMPSLCFRAWERDLVGESYEKIEFFSSAYRFSKDRLARSIQKCKMKWWLG